MAICNTTGTLAIYNEENRVYVSPMADGPIKFEVDVNENIQMKHETKYGRSFSIVEVPYCFKLLMQELISCNVQMRIITEDNIDHLTSMIEGSKTLVFKDKKIQMKKLLEQRTKKNEAAQLNDMGGVEESKGSEEEPKTVGSLDELVPEYVSPNAGKEDGYDDDDDDSDNEQLELPEILQKEENLPWMYISNEDESMYISILRDSDGHTTDIWAEQNPPVPNIYPAEWDHSVVKKYNLDEVRIVKSLKENQSNGNWNKVIAKLIEEKLNTLEESEKSNNNNQSTYVPNLSTNPNSPVFQLGSNSNTNNTDIATNISNIATKSIDNLAALAGNTGAGAVQAATNITTQGAQQLSNTMQSATNSVSKSAEDAGKAVSNLSTSVQSSVQNATDAIDNTIDNTMNKIVKLGSNESGDSSSQSGGDSGIKKD